MQEGDTGYIDPGFRLSNANINSTMGYYARAAAQRWNPGRGQLSMADINSFLEQLASPTFLPYEARRALGYNVAGV